jgi:Protein of unknown function (DUF1612)/HTH DNA binding domain
MNSMAYEFSNLPLDTLFAPVMRATATLTRLDERLSRSPVRDGWIERSHFHDACASLWVDGELVHLEDLVLHDANRDIRTPTHELTQAHAVLRTRRQIFGNKPDWALSRAGVQALNGGGHEQAPETKSSLTGLARANEGEEDSSEGMSFTPNEPANEFSDIDVVLRRTEDVLSRVPGGGQAKPDLERDPLVYEEGRDEDKRLVEWLALVRATKELPPVLRAAIALDAWWALDVLQRALWLGRLLVAGLLREAGVTTAHLVAFNLGLKGVPREKRQARDQIIRILALVQAMEEAAVTGLKEHDRLVLAREQMQRRLKGKRANSKLPQLIELVLARPLVSSTMIEKELKVSLQGALNLVGELNMREMTGRGRFRAWGVV